MIYGFDILKKLKDRLPSSMSTGTCKNAIQKVNKKVFQDRMR